MSEKRQKGLGSRLFWYKIIRELIEKQRMLFNTHGHKVLSHVISPEISIHAKDTAFERASKSAQNTHMRNKSVGFVLNAVSLCLNLFLSIQIL